jgi:polygalacturonase
MKTGTLAATGILFAGTTGLAAPDEPMELNILDFNAVGDGKTLNTVAIQQTIDACGEKNGGRVIVPPGTYLTGSLVLKSNVTLYLQKGAILLASPYFKDFPLRPFEQEIRYQKYLKRALIYAWREKNISVSGEGILDGNALLDGSGEFQEKKAENPTLIWFEECENITVKDVTFRHSVWWTQAYTRCRQVHVDHIMVTENYFHNADGIDLLDCEDFLVENCDINADDDGICLKGYTAAGCRNGVIRKNRVRTLCNGIKMGTDSSGGFREILIEDNEVWQTGISGVALQIVDGGIMENITVRNIRMNGVGTPVTLRLGDRNRPIYGELTVRPGILRNVKIHDIQATVNRAEKFNDEERKRHNYPAFASSICGIPGNSIENVTLENMSITIQGGFPPATADAALRDIPEAGNKYPENRMFGMLPAFGFYIRHARNIQMNHISVAIEQPDGRPAFMLDDVQDSVFDDISVKSITQTPVFSVHQNCSGIVLNR